jgi:hypothetical protein
MMGGVPSSAVLNVRDKLRAPDAPIEQDPAIAPLVDAVNARLANLLPGQPKLQIRLTSTDSESVLKALVPHYVGLDGTSLPAGRHGGGLLALQTLILLLETGRMRRAANQSFILALEEPELHVPPGLQRQIVSEARSIANQTICTTHAPRVGACYAADLVHVVRRLEADKLVAEKLLSGPDLNIANAARKLLVDERLRLLEALMYPLVLVPEGRIDFEFVRLITEIAHGSGPGASRFETSVGTVPTPDSSVVATATRLIALRAGVFAVVDGDGAGDGYVTSLAALASPPSVVVQWPKDWAIEDVVAWIAGADPGVVAHASARIGGAPMADPAALASRLKSDDRAADGLKQHYLAYEEVAFALRESEACATRATSLLEELADVAANGPPGELFAADAARSTSRTVVLRFVPT